MSNQQQLFSRIAAGDSEAFSQAHAVHKAPLLYYAKRFLAEWDDAEDIVADAFLALWQSRRQIGSDTHIRNFLFMTVRNKAINLLQARKRQGTFLEQQTIAEITEVDMVNPERVETEMMLLLNRAVKTLPGECRKIFELTMQQRSPAEIAELLQIAPATARSQKRRAIQLIQTWMQKNGLEIMFLYFFQKFLSLLLHVSITCLF